MSDTIDPSTTDDAFARLEVEPSLPGRERVTTPATWFLVVMLGLGAAFVGGAWWGQRHQPTTTTTAAAAAAATGRGQGAGLATGVGGQVAAVTTTATTVPAAAVTSGTIKLIDGRNVYVSTADGRTIKLVLGTDGAVQIPASGAITDLAAGAAVTWSGTPNADGTIVTAKTITKS
jgi:hypothetical protein